jgi:hypothetical protein
MNLIADIIIRIRNETATNTLQRYPICTIKSSHTELSTIKACNEYAMRYFMHICNVL